MEYVGIQTQQSRNNFRSVFLLFMFPTLVAGLTYLFCFLFDYLIFFLEDDDEMTYVDVLGDSTIMFVDIIPYVLGAVLIWFLIAYFINAKMIDSATGSVPLQRKDNKRVYNLVENLCMTQGMKTPKIHIINDKSLNAFASGINERTYTVTLTRGIIEKLNDEELEGVIAHELSHIRNHDVQVLIISIVFVGIFSLIAQICVQWFCNSSSSSDDGDNKGSAGIAIFLVMIIAVIGYLFSLLMRFAISRKREYMADAGSAEMTKNPLALASALRKISKSAEVKSIERSDVAQLFIAAPIKDVFATHPPIEKRIEILEQF